MRATVSGAADGREGCEPGFRAYLPRERWVNDVPAYARDGEPKYARAPFIPTSHEAGMRKEPRRSSAGRHE